jgi:hypothetical protein
MVMLQCNPLPLTLDTRNLVITGRAPRGAVLSDDEVPNFLGPLDHRHSNRFRAPSARGQYPPLAAPNLRSRLLTRSLGEVADDQTISLATGARGSRRG